MTNDMTPADFAAMTGGFGNNGGILGGSGGILGLLVLFFVFMMFGNTGWGNRNDSGTTTALPFYSQSNDFSNLERENDIIRSDICNNFANTNQILATGFQGIQTSFANAELSRANTAQQLTAQMYGIQMAQQQQAADNAMAMMQGFNGTTNATTQGFAQTNYNLAQQGCDTRNTLQTVARDITDAQTAGTNAILTALNAQAMEAKNDRIADLERRLDAANLAASQAAQNQYLVGQLAPKVPVAAYNVPNPFTGSGCNGCCGNYA